jgi:hypothetical protein
MWGLHTDKTPTASITVKKSTQASQAEQEEEVGFVLVILFLVFTCFRVNCLDS